MKKLFFLLALSLTTIPTFSQDSTFQEMLDYSRPGKYHQLLADLVGNWSFEGSRFDWVDSVTSKAGMKLAGSLVRKPFANGRFFIAELTTAAKIQLPIQDGKMTEDYAKGLQTEGYDNVKKKFQLSYINNHIGSDITFWEGLYNSTTKTISFFSEMENVPGMKLKIRFDFVFIDKNHYQWNYFMEQNGKYIKDTEMNFIRIK
ncbi:MAG: DUF1579 family protein [Ferruginibacter sp.]